MIASLRFAFGYALRNMLRDRQRTVFGVFSVAAGVATVVALRTLGLMLTDALTSNAQAFLRGDVRVEDPYSGGISIFGEDQDFNAFNADTVPQITQWAAENNVDITFKLNNELMQTAVIEGGRARTPVVAIAVFVDPQVYPFYDTLRAEEPAGTPFNALFTAPNQVVLARRMANQLDAQVGDQLRIGSADALFTVVGIVPDYAESSLEGRSAGNTLLFSFVYLDRAQQPAFGLPEFAATTAYLRLPPEISQEEAQERVRREWQPPYDSGSRWRITQADDTLARNVVITDAIGRFVLLLSLVGLVIGGVGIINTMLVAVNRRSAEIAVMKTLGLNNRGIMRVFLAEALLLGLAGSAVGIVVGNLLSLLARDLGQQAFAVPLPWRVYLDPALMGVALGVIMTLFFSFLPIIMTARVRPVYVLRQGSIPVARAGCLPTLLNMALLVIGFGLLVDLIIGTDRFETNIQPPLTLGIVGTFIVFLTIMLIVVLMWLLVWLLGRLPAFRNANLRLAMRGLTTHRTRTAFSLLALITGMSALSGTLILSRSINILLYTSISDPIGGNVLILPLPFIKPSVQQTLSESEGVNGYRDVRFPTSIGLRAIDGQTDYWSWFANDDDDPNVALRRGQIELVLGITVYGEPRRGTLVEGRFLGAEDAGQPNIVIPYIPELAERGVGVGSTFTYEVYTGANRRIAFTVVGVVAPDATQSLIPFSFGDSAVQIPVDMMPQGGGGAPAFDFIIADVEQEAVDDTLSKLAALPGAFVFDVRIFDSILNRLLSQLAALPLLVAALALFAATTLIATTVSLATLERRKQIATMKALGVSRGQVLGQLLIENGIVGVVGGLISLLPTVLILVAIPALTSGLVTLPVPYELIALMLALAVGITLGATLLTAWRASGEKPLNVLRYE